MAALCCFWWQARAGEPVVIQADFSKSAGVIRPLHGVNKGPLGPGGLTDLTQEHRDLAIPLTRLHDCYWPNPYVVDIHAVFPNFDADPSQAESYDFRLTDEYLAAIRAAGSQIVYRLGESIEHTSVKRFAHPPADMEKWTAICLGIIRHYNEGWANGHHYGIRYWEIWNEPENRPVMWSGTDEDYFRLYQTAATAIKKEFPELKVGGPAVGASGNFRNGAFQPTDFVRNFLRLCRESSLPLDFFSWHCYTDDPPELAARARAMRALLDAHGFAQTESHLNEWNYLPGNSWDPISRSSPAAAREKYYQQMAGAPGAAFIASALIQLQNAPLDAANLFHGELGAFGLFNEFGVPQKNYYALRAFRQMLETPARIEVNRGSALLDVLAGKNADQTRAAVLMSSASEGATEVRVAPRNLPWAGDTVAKLHRVDAARNFDLVRTEILEPGSPVSFRQTPPAVTLLEFSPARSEADRSMTLSLPPAGVVFQRSLEGRANIPVAGFAKHPGAAIEARLLAAGASADSSPWQVLAQADENGAFGGVIEGVAGWHTLETRARTARGIVSTSRVERVGVGEVFLVAGHSVAQGQDINLPGSVDGNVVTVPLAPPQSEQVRQYEKTGDPQYLPALAGAPFASGVRPAPFGHGTYFWAAFGERLARREQAPVMIFNAAFGGTSLEHWAKSARGERFEHSFVRSRIRMPHINVRNALQKYAAITGLRAALADQGQNDAGQTNASVIFANYQASVEQARKDLGFQELAVMVNRQTPYPDRAAVRQAQERIIREVSHCYPGPDYDTLSAPDRPDRIHLGESGAQKASVLWEGAVSAGFLKTARPYLPDWKNISEQASQTR